MKSLLFFVSLLIATFTTAAEFDSEKVFPVLDNTTAKYASNLKGGEKANGYRISHVSASQLYLYPAKKEIATGQAVVICPGGGYAYNSMENEGVLMAKWFVQQGITAAVLKYRMPNGIKGIPLEDVTAAFKIMRGLAPTYAFEANKVGIVGSSAGGHLAATASTLMKDDEKPNFTILFYPVISAKKGCIHAGSFNNLLGRERTAELDEAYSLETRVTAKTPPAFLIHCDDDRAVPPRNATLYYNALKQYRIPAALYIYPKGGHGFGFYDRFPYKKDLQTNLLNWLKLR